MRTLGQARAFKLINQLLLNPQLLQLHRSNSADEVQVGLGELTFTIAGTSLLLPAATDGVSLVGAKQQMTLFNPSGLYTDERYIYLCNKVRMSIANGGFLSGTPNVNTHTMAIVYGDSGSSDYQLVLNDTNLYAYARGQTVGTMLTDSSSSAKSFLRNATPVDYVPLPRYMVFGVNQGSESISLASTAAADFTLTSVVHDIRAQFSGLKIRTDNDTMKSLILASLKSGGIMPGRGLA